MVDCKCIMPFSLCREQQSLETDYFEQELQHLFPAFQPHEFGDAMCLVLAFSCCVPMWFSDDMPYGLFAM